MRQLYKRIIIKTTLLPLLILVVMLVSCDNKTSDTFNDKNKLKVRSIDLFPMGKVYNNSDKLSLEEAFNQCKDVLKVSHIEKIDSSNTRGVTPFYIYKVNGGTFEKSATKKKNIFPLLFLSEQELFEEKSINDSVYLFLIPTKGYEVLQKNMGIKYMWMNEAPFVSKNTSFNPFYPQ